MKHGWYRQATAMRFAWDMLCLCEEFDGSESSGCRSKARNAAVGGHPQSRHTLEHGWGLARDLHFPTDEVRGLAKARAEQMGWYTYVGPTYKQGQLHVQAFRSGDPLPGES